MATIQKMFRLSESEVATLKRVADERGCSMTDVIRSCISEIDTCISSVDTENSSSDNHLDADMIHALTDQLAAKDAQISRLQDLLDQSQKLVAIQARPTLAERVRALFAPRP